MSLQAAVLTGRVMSLSTGTSKNLLQSRIHNTKRCAQLTVDRRANIETASLQRIGSPICLRPTNAFMLQTSSSLSHRIHFTQPAHRIQILCKKAEKKSGPPTILNRRARFDFEIIDTVEAGIVLQGSEIKSIFEGKANIGDAYGMVLNGECWLFKAHVTPYEKSHSYDNHEANRKRKLLLHKREILKLRSQITEKGMSLVPLKMYFSNNKVKVELGVARGKNKADKRESIKKAEGKKALQRMVKAFNNL